MFYGEESKKRVRTAREELQDSPFLFYLTGSRYFGTEREDSDWDYFVQAGSRGPMSKSYVTLNGGVEQASGCSVEDWLLNHGWQKDSESYAEDLFSTQVYKREDTHVQVVASAKVKQWAQYKIKDLRLCYVPGTVQLGERNQEGDRRMKGMALPKEDMARIWHLALSMYKAGMEYDIHDVNIPFMESYLEMHRARKHRRKTQANFRPTLEELDSMCT
jgi:hypothetical protein